MIIHTGGGAGMVMQAEPVYLACQSVCDKMKKKPRVVYLTPQGSVFSQKMAEDFSKEEDIVFLCGHYEGIDERVLEEIVTDNVSIGDYVLTGGELPAMVMMDAISRLVKGVLNNEQSAEFESFMTICLNIRNTADLLCGMKNRFLMYFFLGIMLI